MTEQGHHPPVPEQQEAIDDRSRDLFLLAGAGTGKTTVLVQRFCDAVCSTEGPDADVGIENVLAFTFTDKAAAEMKGRIRAELRRRGELELAREAESAWISTIHAFCRRILASHPLAAGLDPRFAVLDETAAGRLAAEAFDAAFDEFASEGELDRVELAAAYRMDDLRDMVITAHDELRSRGDAEPELPALDPPDIDSAKRELAGAAEAALAATEGETRGKAAVNRERMTQALAIARQADEAPAEDQLAQCFFSSSAQGFRVEEVKRFQRALRELEARVVAAANAHRYEHLRELVRVYGREYGERKAARSALDFEDLQLHTRHLLGSRPDLRDRLRDGFRHLMVDEFQDTNRLQLAIVELLHGPGNRLFTVGDELQSIYSFRHADVEVFRELERRSAAAPADEAGVRRLSGNFRSRPELIATVNAVGRELLDNYEELAVGAPPGSLSGDGPAVEVLLTERDGWEEEGELAGVSPDEQAQSWRVAEARFLAARLREHADEGFPRGHMVVLLRAFTYVEAYERALDEQGLSPYVVGGRGYWSRQQVNDLRQLLGAIANPLDELALFGSLASPACGVRPDTLWLLKRAAGGRRAWTALRALYGPGDQELEIGAPELAEHIPADDAERLRVFCATLLELRDAGPALGLEGLIERAIADTGYDLALLMRSEGRRRMANVRKLMRLARDYEAAEGPDLRGFLDFVDSEREIRAREGEAALQAEDHDGVRIMTVHGAKGLEFPLVAVADLGRGLGGGFPPALRLHPGGAETEEEPGAVRVGLRLARLGRKQKPIFEYTELQELSDELTGHEERRTLHVALTRAQQRLILSGGVKREKLARGEPPRPTAPLFESVLPALGWSAGEDRVNVPAARPRPGLDTEFGPAEVAVRVNAPGGEGQRALHVPRGAEPVDESPLAQPLPDAELAPLAAAAEGPPVRSVSYSALALYERCGYRFYAQRVLGMEPEPPAGVEPPGGHGDRYAHGRVVHELLERGARTGWAAPAPGLAADLLRREGSAGGAREVERVLGLVEGFRGSELCASLAGAGLSPEAPFAFRLGGLLVRGEIDLLAQAGNEVVVVDYKSDRLDGADPAGLMPRYDVQRRIYALATLRAHRLPVRVVYVFLERPDAPVEQRFEPAEADELTAGLAALCERIERREFAVTDNPGRELCFDCPARRRLCVHPPERTLAA
ncbi:MAG: UvrD-helicase domain-containing protein [Thermoleophilaceae bacterium]